MNATSRCKIIIDFEKTYNKPVFSSVIVVTDRKVLDSQLQDTISGFDHTMGAVETIGDGKQSKDLRDAINNGAIEDVDFSKTKEQIFLYTYRAFALEYHKKQEAVKIEQNYNIITPHSSFASDFKIDGKTGFDMSVSDYEKEKSIFDNALINSNYDVLTSIVWEFEGFSNFAATGGEAPMMDYDNQVIQNLLNPNVPVGHIYITVFPENDKTYAIISWLKEYDSTFSTIKKKLDNISEQEKKNYINNTLPIIAENIAIKPSSWNAIPSYAKEEFFMLFAGISELMQIEGQIYDRFQKPSFDLFEL